MACWTRADPGHVRNAHEKTDCKVEKASTTGTGHVARSLNDNEEITSTKNIDQVGKEHAGHNKRPPTKKGPRRGPHVNSLCTLRGLQAPEQGKHVPEVGLEPDSGP
jgi:hypothetical protein